MTHTIHHGEDEHVDPVPARVGARVTCIADAIAYDGTVTGSHGDAILVRFDDGLEGFMFPEDLIFHPTSQQEAQ